MNENSDTSSPSWFEKPANVNRLVVGLAVACVTLLVVELIFGSSFYDEHHPAHFPLEQMFGYQALLGFVAFVVVVFLGTMLRFVIRRSEDYYDQ
jgi:sterol desaturase/sphingolipid hydroxylase (fatty acid hydroxylase superfamily)